MSRAASTGIFSPHFVQLLERCEARVADDARPNAPDRISADFRRFRNAFTQHRERATTEEIARVLVAVEYIRGDLRRELRSRGIREMADHDDY